MEPPSEVLLKRVYAPAEPSDGRRVLVDRLWPRGLSKTAAAVDEWLRDVAPSPALRRWWDHDPDRFDEFAARYRAELAGGPALELLLEQVRRGRVTLLFAARDEHVNHAVVLADVLRERLATEP
jgi:uncharacterized protein YeaO (DUF488 family)